MCVSVCGSWLQLAWNLKSRLCIGQRSMWLRSVWYRSSIEDGYFRCTGVGDADVDFVPLICRGFLRSSKIRWRAPCSPDTAARCPSPTSMRNGLPEIALPSWVTSTNFLLRLKTDHAFNHNATHSTPINQNHQSIYQSVSQKIFAVTLSKNKSSASAEISYRVEL